MASPVGMTLLHLDSDYIVRFIAEHPIDWQSRELAGRGGSGDTAGVTPTPAVGEFLSLLHQRQDLFTQEEYRSHCIARWRDWWISKTDIQQQGVTSKLYRNFFVSMIDSLHVWALLSEAKWFDSCMMDSYRDAIGKTDIVLRRGHQEIRVALYIASPQAVQDRQYKLQCRSNGEPLAADVLMTLDRPKSPGNKRWYKLSDFEDLRP